MFSPEAAIPSGRGSLRNPRRRQRKDSDGLPQQPLRKRNKISQDTFHSTTDAQVNGNGSVVMNGHAGHGDADSSLVLVDMPVREKKAVPKRAPKDDSALYLTKNDNYSIKKLPSFPANLSQVSKHFRGFALPSAGLALALTSSHALAWDYTSISGPSKVLTLPLTFGLKPSDPLPFGAIVRNGPTNDFGILAVAASNGKIIFWDNVDSAEASSHFPQRQQGVDGSVKIYSGEVVTGLVDIEHAGYVIILSSGRLVQLTLRDSQGRPSISTNALQAPSGSGGSFFSFKGLLSGAIRKSVASVKARPSQSKGQMEVITATKNGLFQMWDLSWSGQQIFKNDIDVHGEILAAIQGGTPPESREQQEAHVLDFAILDHQKTPAAVGLLVLVALTGRDMLEYSLLEVDLSSTNGTVTRAIPIRTFQQDQPPKEPTGTLLVPASGKTALVQFPGAVVIVSLAEPEESPNTQLLADSGRSTLPFQDTVYLRNDRHLDFCGQAIDCIKKDGTSGAFMFVQGYGIIHISALPSESGDVKITAKSKLEQATFYSTLSDNILDFSVRSRYTFAQGDVEDAAIAISTDILSSAYDHLDKVTSSMDEQFRKRAFALRTLVSHLRAEYPPLSYPTKWELMWHAEKLAAAQALWSGHQSKVQEHQAHPEAYMAPLLIPDMVKELHERYKTKLRPELGETDPVRQFFLKDINTVDVLLPWAWQDLRTFWLGKRSKERSAVLQRLSDSNDVILVALEAAFRFRKEHVELYGFDPAAFYDGMLLPDQGQDMLPQFWTSKHNMVASVRSLVDIGRNIAYESFEKGEHQGLAMKIASDNPRLVRLCCNVHTERFTWGCIQSDEKKRDMGKSLREEFITNVRPEQIYGLVELGQALEGMNLAEYYRDMPTLARLIWEETRFLEEAKEGATSKMEQAECVVKLNRIKDRVHRYFEEFGTTWADAFYSKFITEHCSGKLFDKQFLNQPALTQFLRKDRSRSRLTWINEVCGEKKYEVAHSALVTAAVKQETNAWCKKVELSIAKLSLLAKQQVDKTKDAQLTEKEDKSLARTNAQLEYTKIQEQLYERFHPTILGALDDESAVQLLMERYAQGRLATRPAHQALLKQGFENLVQNRVLEPPLLIDVLTLMTYDESAPAIENTQSNEFVLALKALALTWNDTNKASRKHLSTLIWKRILIQDDWAEINNTRELSDAQISEHLLNTVAGWTWKGLEKLTLQNNSYKIVWPKFSIDQMLGAGCTDGELCVRFGSEDLRAPIIADNVADGEALRGYLEKHRLDDWFKAAHQAAKRELMEELGQGQAETAESDDDSGSVEAIEDGDAEDADAEAVGQDVDM